ncbi:PAS domain-containing protein [Paenarthrobacter nitroguajacolicus]|uniref:PAS domain-containing protein n=1 Tax=Paenarthrobacter nitroguajacolicus TaxID=211146 RepID=UPI002855F021|nr:PAS domain-containing protein [Paenarthrobacter nitroguajacolicus]MDR6637049.1 PAS domain S-box-containing protein [Paenarthrobacter nitroguajacolicus]
MSTTDLGPAGPDASAMLSALQHCILVHDAKTKDILWANPAACRMLGFTLEELLPLKAPDMSGRAKEYSRSIGRRWLQDAVEHGTSSIEWMYRTRDGVDILTEAIAVSVDLADRPVVMVEFRNIEREHALKADLEQASARLQTFIGKMGEGILVVNPDDRIAYANGAVETLLALTLGTAVGTALHSLCVAESVPVLDAALRAAASGQTPTCSLQLNCRDAGPRWFRASLYAIDLKGDLSGTMLFLRDITEQVEAQTERERDLERLNYLARYNVMGDMAMALSHELGQPLAAATNFVDGLRRRVENGKVEKDGLRLGLENAARQLARANQILRSLRGYVGTLEASEQHADLNDIVQDCLYFMELTAERHRVEISVHLATRPLPVLCEKVLIGQVMVNLCRNAVEEVARLEPDRRKVIVETAVDDQSAVVRVIDKGTGLGGFPGGRIFDGAFTTKENGSGLGLALSHRIVTRQRGKIGAGENPEGGSTFWFGLPLTDPNEGPECAEESSVS